MTEIEAAHEGRFEMFNSILTAVFGKSDKPQISTEKPDEATRKATGRKLRAWLDADL